MLRLLSPDFRHLDEGRWVGSVRLLPINAPGSGNPLGCIISDFGPAGGPRSSLVA